MLQLFMINAILRFLIEVFTVIVLIVIGYMKFNFPLS